MKLHWEHTYFCHHQLEDEEEEEDDNDEEQLKFWECF